MEQLFRSARKRGLDRVGAAYAVVAWLVVQAASIALPAFDAPPWVMRWLIVVAIAAFPAVLLLAWHWNEDRAAGTAGPGWRRWLVPGTLALVLLASLVQLAVHWARVPVRPAGQPGAAIASVAVLPFANLSGDPAKRYFSDGIADQLITELSRHPNLRVAARTSSFALASGKADVRTIARTLNVRAVLEGSVREDGNRVRIAAELIDATDGFQIWSESYDRDLTDILALQDDIARAISRALSRKLSGRDAEPGPAQARPSIDPEAYRDTLQGQFYFAQRSEEGIGRAIALFEQATKRAPNYADAYAALGAARAARALNFMRGDEIVPATVAIDRALALDAGNQTALMARATVSIVEWKWRAAADDLQRVEASDPGAPGLWHFKGVFLSYMALTRLALPAVEKAVRQDPLSYIDRYNLAIFLLPSGRRNEALKVALQGIAIQPGNPEGQELLCQIYAVRGDLEQAGRIRMQLASSPSAEARLPAIACAYHIAVGAHDSAAVRKLADATAATFPGNGAGANDIAVAYARAGDISKALGWFETAYQLREPQVAGIEYNNPDFRTLYADPRWKAFRDKPEFHDWEAARREVAKRFQLGE